MFAPLAKMPLGYGGVAVLTMRIASTPMTISPLPNYLRSNRKRMALSQEEVAFLLGMGNGQQVCRHERFVREPSLEVAFAYEAIYKRTTSELFSGMYQKIERMIAARAEILAAKMTQGKTNRRIIRKLQILSTLAGKNFDIDLS